jgi:ribosomal protein S18 acetylase RimI-like enzyme
VSSAKILKQSENQFVFSLEEGMASEIIVLDKLRWDSKILRRNCARISAITGNAENRSSNFYQPLVDTFRQLGLEYVDVRRSQGEWQRIHGLEAAGFCMIDGILEFGSTVDKAKSVEVKRDYSLKLATSADAGMVAAAAGQIEFRSRFFNDPLTAKYAAEINSEWAKNSCLNKDHGVWLAMHGSQVAGFITCEKRKQADAKPTGVIGLVGVLPQHQGHGLGPILVQRACNWFLEQGFQNVTVKTQTDNHGALRLYGKMGFHPIWTAVTLRWAGSGPLVSRVQSFHSRQGYSDEG